MGDQLRQLYADGRLLIEHELGFQKRRLKFVGDQSKSAGKLLLLATAFILGGAIALIVGVLIALIPLLGAWGSTFAVTAFSLIIAAGAFFLAISRIKAIARVFSTKDEENNNSPENVRSQHSEV